MIGATQDQNLATVQKLLITQQFRQSLAILAMPAVELQSFLDEQLAENCVLELADPAEAPEGDWEAGAPPEQPADLAELAEYLGNSDDWDQGAVAPERSPAGSGHEYCAGPVPSLADQLLQQLRLNTGNRATLAIGSYLIENIDDDGYLRCSVAEAAEACGASVATVERVLKLVQSFEPCGVGARDLAECLLLQLGAMADPSQAESVAIAVAIARDHLEALAGRKLARIALELKQPYAKVQAAVALIRRLNPRPGRLSGAAEPEGYLIPDITFQRSGADWLILVNEPDSARLRLNPFYGRLLRQKGAIDRSSLEFLEKKWRAALNLIKAVEQRRLTLTKLAGILLELQRPFFDRGPSRLRPLTLKQMADAAGFHESTVSRAADGKYVATPFGLYPFKYFFSGSIATDAATGASTTAIKALLREIIEAEAKLEPFSDQQLAGILQGHGIRISRRTIAKYREELGIPASGLRRAF